MVLLEFVSVMEALKDLRTDNLESPIVISLTSNGWWIRINIEFANCFTFYLKAASFGNYISEK